VENFDDIGAKPSTSGIVDGMLAIWRGAGPRVPGGEMEGVPSVRARGTDESVPFGFKVWVYGLGFRVGKWCRAFALDGGNRGFRIQGAGCKVQGAGCKVQGARCRVQGLGMPADWCRLPC